MTSRVIRSDEDLTGLIAFLGIQSRPFTVSIMQGANRTTEQNKLQFKWMKEISEQWPGHKPEDIRAHCKLHFGVPILRRDDEEFKRKYDLIIKPHSYEEKLVMMKPPLDFPVTSLMTTRQKTEYLDTVFQKFSEQGFELTIPPEKESGADSSSPGALSGRVSPSAETGSRGSPSRATGANRNSYAEMKG